MEGWSAGRGTAAAATAMAEKAEEVEEARQDLHGVVTVRFIGLPPTRGLAGRPAGRRDFAPGSSAVGEGHAPDAEDDSCSKQGADGRRASLPGCGRGAAAPPRAAARPGFAGGVSPGRGRWSARLGPPPGHCRCSHRGGRKGKQSRRSRRTRNPGHVPRKFNCKPRLRAGLSSPGGHLGVQGHPHQGSATGSASGVEGDRLSRLRSTRGEREPRGVSPSVSASVSSSARRPPAIRSQPGPGGRAFTSWADEADGPVRPAERSRPTLPGRPHRQFESWSRGGRPTTWVGRLPVREAG